jgi:hypothetical protein
MATLSARQIAGYAKAAGFSGTNLTIAVAVSLAESGGRTAATNHNTNGSTDYGLWQINTVHGSLLASGQWSNPADNARMAYAVWKEQGWHGWTTFNTGAYMAHMGAAMVASGNPADVAGITSGSTPATWKSIGAPFDPKTLTPKNLTPAKIARIRTWCKNAATKQPRMAVEVANMPDPKTDPAGFIRVYGMVVDFVVLHGNPVVLPNPVHTIQDLINAFDFLTNGHNWVRMAEFVAGGLLVLIAAYKISGTEMPSGISHVAKAVKA